MQMAQYVERSHQRRATTAVRCNLGNVVDLSRGGVRIAGSARASGPVRIQLYAMDRQIDAKGKVVWSRGVGQFKRETGVAFVGLSRRDAEAIDMLARENQGRRFL